MSLNTILATAPLTTQNYILKATGTTIGNSLIWDNGTNVGIGNTNTSYTLDVSGTGRFTGNGYVGGNLGIGTLIPSGIVNGLGLVVYDTNYPRVILQNSTTGTGTGAYSGLFMVGSDVYLGNSTTSGKLYLGVATNSSVLTITSAGNVGIGVTPAAWASPTAGKVIQIGNRAALFSYNNQTLDLATNFYFDGGDYRYIESAYATLLRASSADGTFVFYNAASGTAGGVVSLNERLRITSDGLIQLYAGTNQATGGYYNTFGNLYVASTTAQGTDIGGSISIGGKYNGAGAYATFARIQGKKENSSSGQTGGYLAFEVCTDLTNLNTERMRITSGGKVMVNTSDSGANALLYASASSSEPYPLGSRAMTSSQGLVGFFDSANGLQGSISISGSTVSYNSFLGSHWSQLSDNSKPEILTGTILEAIDELCVWDNVTDERLPKVKISDSIESKNVYGVFSNWDNTDDYNDMYVAAVGAGFIRVNSSSIVSMGDLLQSNGDGTAKIQSDDIMRSSTIAKVTSTQKITTYEDGSYLIAATLHCG